MSKMSTEITRFYNSMPLTIELPLPSVYAPATFDSVQAPEPAFVPAPMPAPVKDTRVALPSHASYLEPLIMEPEAVIRHFRQMMKGVKFDTLVGTGVSGTVAALLLARATRKHYAIVRKPSESTHSCNRIEGIVGRRWLFVDDLVCSGDTRHRVKKAMKHFCERHEWTTQYVGAYLYYTKRYQDGTSPAEDRS